MAVVAVRKHFGRGVANPGLVDVGIDLILSGDFAEPACDRLILARVFVALVAIENAYRDGNTETSRVVGCGSLVIALDRGIRSSIGVGQLDVRICYARSRLGCPVVRPCCQRFLFQVSQSAGYGRGDDIPVMSNVRLGF